MKKHFVTLAVAVLGFVAGRLWDQEPASAQGGGAGEGNVPPCQDVNGDGDANIADPVFLLNWLFMSGPAPTCPDRNGQPVGLPATGQTECYGLVEGEDGQEWAAVPCEGADIPGQDGAYQAGCPMEGRFIDNGDRTVTDTCTGLVWQKDTTDVNGDGAIDPDVDGGDAVGWQDALKYCENLTFASHDDWRLPNVRELQSIVDYGRYDPAIDPVFGALSSAYWSSSTYAVYPDVAWLVGFNVGFVVNNLVDKDALFHVRAVRSGP